jgi:Nitronate monooxygenase
VSASGELPIRLRAATHLGASPARVGGTAGAQPGGIAGGAGLAAALALGAQGVSMGTRFLASTETGVHHDWKRRVDAEALGAVKVVNDDPIMPPYTRGGVRSQARALDTPLITALREHPNAVDPAVAGPELIAAIRAGRGDQFLPFAGQSAALIHDVLQGPPAGSEYDHAAPADSAPTFGFKRLRHPSRRGRRRHRRRPTHRHSQGLDRPPAA